MKFEIFLGGTCGNNNWRDGFIRNVIARGVPEEALFNPVVKVWNDEARTREERVKKSARFLFFYLGDPREATNRRSFVSLFEATSGLYDDSDRTIVVVDIRDMPKEAQDSVREVFLGLKKRFPEAPIFDNLREAEDYLAEQYRVVPFTALPNPSLSA